jgi:hypothetical protein
MDDAEMREEAGWNRSGSHVERGPAAWVCTEVLECELWNAIAEDFSQSLDIVADYDDDGESLTVDEVYVDEAEMRDSLFRQLADLRPELGDLLSGPQLPEEG